MPQQSVHLRTASVAMSACLQLLAACGGTTDGPRDGGITDAQAPRAADSAVRREASPSKASTLGEPAFSGVELYARGFSFAHLYRVSSPAAH